MMTTIGQRNRQITIQQPVTTKVNGVSTTTWVTFKAGIWASIKTMRAYERANANAVWPGADVKIITPYLIGITGAMRIVDDAGVIYTIKGQPNDIDRRHREIELICQSGTA